jgi:hypothetical protein
MAQSSQQTFRIIVIIMAVALLCLLAFVGALLFLNRPLSATAIAATLTAMPSPTSLPTSTPTPAPPVPGISEPLLICQRQAGQAMSARGMPGAANLSDDHLLLMKWVSMDWPVQNLDDAMPGVVTGLDVALDVWNEGCTVFDRVQVEVYDRRDNRQALRLTVLAQVDDVLKWRAGEMRDSDLIARLTVTQPEAVGR